MKALLLIAGRSKRFWPLDDKMLFPLCGTTLLERQIALLRLVGVKEILLVGGEHNIKPARKLAPDLTVIRQENLDLGMQGALLSALPACKKESVLILSSNDILEPRAIKDLLAAVKRPGVQGAILGKKMKEYFPGGYIVSKHSRVTAIVEKPGPENAPSDLVNIVTHIHGNAQQFLDVLRKVKSNRDDGYEIALTKLMKDAYYRVVPYSGLWQPVKYPWHLLPLLGLFLGEIRKPRIAKGAKIHRTAVIEGNVILEDGVNVLPHATIVGPSTIGRGSVIGTGSLVRGSSIGERCVIGYGSEIKSSILAADVWTHGTYIGDSIIGPNVSFGGGSVTGNFRLDGGDVLSSIDKDRMSTGLRKFGLVVGEGARIGIRTGTNPGVKIGRGTFIAGGTFIKDDIPDNRFVCMKNGEMHVRENTAELPSTDLEGRRKP